MHSVASASPLCAITCEFPCAHVGNIGRDNPRPLPRRPWRHLPANCGLADAPELTGRPTVEGESGHEAFTCGRVIIDHHSHEPDLLVPQPLRRLTVSDGSFAQACALRFAKSRQWDRLRGTHRAGALFPSA
jgi:hypothetical protein